MLDIRSEIRTDDEGGIVDLRVIHAGKMIWKNKIISKFIHNISTSSQTHR
jgi:hypothetical protein